MLAEPEEALDNLMIPAPFLNYSIRMFLKTTALMNSCEKLL